MTYFKVVFLLPILCFCFFDSALAITLEEAIDSASKQSTEIQIEEQKSELTSLSKADAATMFLPDISAGYRNGDRKTSISGADRKLKEDTRNITVSQPVFNGFQGISRVKESIAKTDAAKEELKAKKNDIALEVAESYINILKLRKIIKIEEEQIFSYKRILDLAKQRLSLNDIPYSEYNDYETKNQNIILAAETNKSRLIEQEVRFENLVKQKADNLATPTIQPNLMNFDDMLNLAQNENPRIKSTKLGLKAARSAVNAEKGKLLPKVAVSFQHEDQKSSYYFGGAKVTNDVVYLDVTIPIFKSGSEYSSIAKAGKERQMAELRNRLAYEEVEKITKEEYSKFNSFKQSLVTFKEVFKNSSESLKLIEDRFKKKDIGQMDLLLKKVEVAEVEKQTNEIEGNMFSSYFRLKALTNDIF